MLPLWLFLLYVVFSFMFIVHLIALFFSFVACFHCCPHYFHFFFPFRCTFSSFFFVFCIRFLLSFLVLFTLLHLFHLLFTLHWCFFVVFFFGWVSPFSYRDLFEPKYASHTNTKSVGIKWSHANKNTFSQHFSSLCAIIFFPIYHFHFHFVFLGWHIVPKRKSKSQQMKWLCVSIAIQNINTNRWIYYFGNIVFLRGKSSLSPALSLCFCFSHLFCNLKEWNHSDLNSQKKTQTKNGPAQLNSLIRKYSKNRQRK